MVEVLGATLGLLLAWLGWWLLRCLRAVARALRRGGLRVLRPRPLAGVLRGARLGTARATCQAQAARIAELTAELERTRRALRQARPGGAYDRFARAKRAFALRFHPDQCGSSPPLSRRAVFQEFWPELLRIERG